LNDQIPARVFVNRAFANRQRETRLIYRFDDTEVAIVWGKNTGNLGVVEMQYGGVKLRVTSIERTLIDIAVRPAYAGGPFQVLAAYRGALVSRCS
jgi:predicted transcriptional regulator of viral defense system